MSTSPATWRSRSRWNELGREARPPTDGVKLTTESRTSLVGRSSPCRENRDDLPHESGALTSGGPTPLLVCRGRHGRSHLLWERRAPARPMDVKCRAGARRSQVEPARSSKSSIGNGPKRWCDYDPGDHGCGPPSFGCRNFAPTSRYHAWSFARIAFTRSGSRAARSFFSPTSCLS
jgi:hypothetical protein